MRHRISSIYLAAAALILATLSTGQAFGATLTWDGLGDGHSWNDANNWGGTVPAYFDTLHITTTDVIDNVYRDTSNNPYTFGSTWRGVVYLNQGTVQTPSTFETGQGVFNIGDGVLTNGQRDAIVELGGMWTLDRHSDGTMNVNVRSDGAILGGYFPGYSGHPNRKFEMTVAGGLVDSGNWNFGPDLSDVNKLLISDGGIVNVGILTIDANDIIQFTDNTGVFTAKYGGTFANLDAVNAALGTTFLGAGGTFPEARDNGDGTFSVAVPEPASALLLTLAIPAVAARLRRRTRG